jgi:glyoxylase-like metal-dependent hydrolase (beta-lactamase superfamily II)
MEITSNIFLVGGSEESYQSDASIYLVTSHGESALIDAGTGKGHQNVIRNINALGFSPGSIKYLFLTHCHYDHTGGANAVRKATGCRIVAHEMDAVFVEEGNSIVTAASWYGAVMEKTEVDIKVKEKEALFNLGDRELKFYHTPGHSPGSAVLTTISDSNIVLFGQDVHGPLNDLLLSDRSNYVKSLEFMLSLKADILCEGHFGVITGKEAVRDFIESYL